MSLLRISHNLLTLPLHDFHSKILQKAKTTIPFPTLSFFFPLHKFSLDKKSQIKGQNKKQNKCLIFKMKGSFSLGDTKLLLESFPQSYNFDSLHPTPDHISFSKLRKPIKCLHLLIRAFQPLSHAAHPPRAAAPIQTIFQETLSLFKGGKQSPPGSGCRGGKPHDNWRIVSKLLEYWTLSRSSPKNLLLCSWSISNTRLLI